MGVCVCVCVCVKRVTTRSPPVENHRPGRKTLQSASSGGGTEGRSQEPGTHTHTHIHTNTYTYIYKHTYAFTHVHTPITQTHQCKCVFLSGGDEEGPDRFRPGGVSQSEEIGRAHV